jgi:hypothetical protein
MAVSGPSPRRAKKENPVTQILIDSISNLSIHNGVLRIECAAVGADGQQRPSGTPIVAGAAAAQVLQALINGTQELDKELREQQQMPSAGNA